ncbi:MAG: hypothetical protein Q8Q11_02170 [bacterium]|nr:hypothetical protein [bacterium]MDZ4248307.1 hypothetical protein [Patescibacteria group bacterium]
MTDKHKIGTKLNMDEPFRNLPKPFKRTAQDYWQWGYSAVLSNTDRGVLAEYIVAVLLGIDEAARIPWDACDLRLPDGKKIEVKSTAKLQAWSQGKLNEPRIVLKPTKAYDPRTNTYLPADFNADVYIFCFFKTEKLEKANLLDMSQWDFYVFSQTQIMGLLAGRKSISLKQLESEGFKSISADSVASAVSDLGE